MSDVEQAVGTIQISPQTQTAYQQTTVLVDDPVALVDDSNALVGNQLTVSPVIRVDVQNQKPRGIIVIQR